MHDNEQNYCDERDPRLPAARKVMMARPILILGAAIALPLVLILAITQIKRHRTQIKTHRLQQVSSDTSRIAAALEDYEKRGGFYPTTEQGLRALVSEPSTEPKPVDWHQQLDRLPIDPWGSEYIYFFPGRKDPHHYELYSAGPDKRPDTTDDEGR
jgi:general secretion pathway protein G